MEATWEELDRACALELSVGRPTRITVLIPGQAIRSLGWLIGLAGIAALVHHTNREVRRPR